MYELIHDHVVIDWAANPEPIIRRGISFFRRHPNDSGWIRSTDDFSCRVCYDPAVGSIVLSPDDTIRSIQVFEPERANTAKPAYAPDLMKPMG